MTGGIAMSAFKVASFFAGIGGFDLGFERAGMKVIFQCEKNRFCQKVLKKHWPEVPLHHDIIDLKSDDVPDADLYCGGFPCQDVSLANQGKRKGLKGKRSGLFFEFARIIRQRKPTWVVIENVTGLLNSRNGNDFRVVVETLDEIGYGVAWRVLDAKYFGTPQRRRRVFIIASYKSFSASHVLFEAPSSEIATQQSGGPPEEAADRYGSGYEKPNFYSIQHASVGRKPTAGPQGKGYRDDGETWTLDSRGSADVVCATDDAFRVRETPGVSRGLDSNRYRAIGNAVCVPVVEWLGSRIIDVSKNYSTSISDFDINLTSQTLQQLSLF